MDDAIAYGQCYMAAVNRSDVMTRWSDLRPGATSFGGGEALMRHPLRTVPGYSRAKQSKCGWWTDGFSGNLLRSDLLLEISGHPPSHRLDASLLNKPWSTVSSAPWHVASDAWLRALRGKTVLVVHPFVASMRAQLDKGSEAIWGARDARRIVLPSGVRELKLVAPPVLFAGGLDELVIQRDTSDMMPTVITSSLEPQARPADARSPLAAREAGWWPNALAQLIASVDAAGEFDVALLACGGLGMPLGAHLRATNRSSIYVGGSLQLLFGLLGGRWLNASAAETDFQRFQSEHTLACPRADERPRHFLNYGVKADSSAYWC